MAALDEGEPRELGDLPTRAMNRRLVRCVPALSFLAGAPPSFLRTSGRPNRFNPRGVDCLYFSETETVANLEWDRQVQGTPLDSQPKLVFFARVKLRRVLDLEDPATRRRLDLGDDDLFGAWRGVEPATKPQRLGLLVSRQKAIAAIRYPSDAARLADRDGYNVAIFPAALAAPDRVEILGRSDTPLQVLP